MLNLTSVDPGEIVVFGDRQGKLKTSNVSLDDILVRRRDDNEDSKALYSQNGKLKLSTHVSTVTDNLSFINNRIIKKIA